MDGLHLDLLVLRPRLDVKRYSRNLILKAARLKP